MILYIVGNGFDLAHGMKTSYKDFLWFIYNTYIESESKYGSFDESFCEIIESIDVNITEIEEDRDDDGVPININKNYAAKCLFYMLREGIDREKLESSLWSNLENLLGKIDFELIFEKYNKEDDSFEEDDYAMDDYRDGLTYKWPDIVKTLKIFLVEWIESLESLKSLKSAKFDLGGAEENYYITFNYPLILEEIYRKNEMNVLHIHGKKGDENYIFGHRENLDSEEIGYTLSPTACDNIFETRKELMKEPQITKLIGFLHKLDELEAVYIIGFSFGTADLGYIREINEKFPDVNWYVNDYSDNGGKNLLEYTNVLSDMGISHDKIFVENLLKCKTFC